MNFTPSKYSFKELIAVLRKGVTRGDMQELALETFRRERKHTQ